MTTSGAHRAGAPIPPMPELSSRKVVIAEPERMSLLGLLLGSLLERRLADPRARRHAAALDGDVVVEASGMEVTLLFEAGRIEVRRGGARRARARIRGTLRGLMGVVVGDRRLRSALRGDVRVSGSLTSLWHLLRLVGERA